MSAVAAIVDALRPIGGSWRIEIGAPYGPGWIAGVDLARAAAGPLPDLLERIGRHAGATDRRTIAASFAMRFGWASAMAIAPWLRYRCVPDIALENVSFGFSPGTFLERTAIHTPRGVVCADDPRAGDPTLSTVPDAGALLAALRRALVGQSTPVVDALYEWSGFARLGTWGMLTSSWAAHFTGLCETPGDQRPLLPLLQAFFAGDDVVARMQPRMHAVSASGAIQLYQRRASCCRVYLLPQGSLCASCPLVSDEERLARNLASMRTQPSNSRHSL